METRGRVKKKKNWTAAVLCFFFFACGRCQSASPAVALPDKHTHRERWRRLEEDRLVVRESVHGRMDDVDVYVSTPWGPFHHTRGPAMTSSLFFFSHSHSLTLTLLPCNPLPPAWSVLSLYVPPSLQLQLSSLARRVSLYGAEKVVALFLDLDEMRIGCRMWKRSGTNGGMVQGQSPETKPLWACCMCCICGGICLQLQVPLGPLGSPRVCFGLGPRLRGVGSQVLGCRPE